MQVRVKMARKAKKAVNLSIDAELLAEARAAGTNLSGLLERALLDVLKEQRSETWRKENRESIESMNRYVEKNGLPLQKYRTW